MKSALPWKGNGTIKSFNGLQTRVRIKKRLSWKINWHRYKSNLEAHCCWRWYAQLWNPWNLLDNVTKVWRLFHLRCCRTFSALSIFSTIQPHFLLLEQKLDVLPSAFIYLILALLLDYFDFRLLSECSKLLNPPIFYWLSLNIKEVVGVEILRRAQYLTTQL